LLLALSERLRLSLLYQKSNTMRLDNAGNLLGITRCERRPITHDGLTVRQRRQAPIVLAKVGSTTKGQEKPLPDGSCLSMVVERMEGAW